ncbi:MAG TPA: protein tyrosine phosphatase family protein [Verrucomicrobiae bacterium]|nr:protein tyrosine phosphatase family protein [Verrucomicrobiae bacterium]
MSAGKKTNAALSEIYNFRKIGERLGTAGQPTETQLRAIREAGFEAVINLALPTSDNALANEGSLVTALGMAYVHIPVDFAAPKPQDFRTFCGVMEALEGRPTFIHCAANMRVSAFVFLYRVLHEKAAVAEAQRDLNAIWQPDEVWERFIKEQLS